MDTYLQFLATKASTVDNIPHRIRGKVMHRMLDLCPDTLHASRPDGSNMLLHVGRDAHSCAASAAALAFWLSPPSDGCARTLNELSNEHNATRLAMLASDVAIAALVQPVFAHGATLLLFNTAPHKFAVLCVDNTAVLLHSNQDDTRGGERFSLSEWLGGTIHRWTPDQLSEMIRQLAAATTGTADHQAVCAAYFGGARFKRGHADDYWVVALPVTTTDVYA